MCVWLWGPLPDSDPPASVPRVWSTRGWGYWEGVDPLLQSQLYPPRLGQDRWLQPHRPISKSQEAARDPSSEWCCPAPIPGAPLLLRTLVTELVPPLRHDRF